MDKSDSRQGVSRLSADNHDQLAAAIASLSPDEAQYFMERLEASLRRRKLQLIGYLMAAIIGFLGLVLVFFVYGGREPGTFVGWVFLVPIGGVGLSMFVFGRLADRAGRSGVITPPQIPASKVAASVTTPKKVKTT